MLLPLLLQLDPNTVKSVSDHAPSTPWAVAGMLALALMLLAAYVLKDKLTPKTSPDADGRSAPPCYVPAPTPGSPQSQTCALDHGGMRERMATLEAQSQEILRRGEVILSQGAQAADRAEQTLRKLDTLIAVAEKERDLAKLRAEYEQQRFLAAIAAAGSDTVKTLSERADSTVRTITERFSDLSKKVEGIGDSVRAEASRVITENRRSIDDAAGG